MNKINGPMWEKALHNALVYAGIENEEYACMSIGYMDGLHYFLVHTLCLKYEFFVESASGDVLGINTEPLSL